MATYSFEILANFFVILALILGLMFVVPHIMGYYPLGYDPVLVLNETLPSVALVAVAAIMLLILMGMFGTNFAKGAAPLIAIAAIANKIIRTVVTTSLNPLLLFIIELTPFHLDCTNY
ncbi:hypothetical protein HYT52_00255 [Candidatus Woesearchaeota archaeon]|nr:hypothetical protein [Candidatus Woesearchaeota archaeon]